jgi:hypothetical protein
MSKGVNSNGSTKFTPSIIVNKESTSEEIKLIEDELDTFFGGLNEDTKSECNPIKQQLKDVLQNFSNFLKDQESQRLDKLNLIVDRLTNFNNCLSQENFPEFQQKELNINSTIECVDNVLKDLNEFYLDFYILIKNPEELFFINHDEINTEKRYNNIIYFESNTGDTFLLKNLDGKCNMYFECSTGNIYIFNENNNKWNITCNISSNTVE